ncbi:MAG: hypothetical protein V4537_14455 [Pseudomonadota bacterium]
MLPTIGLVQHFRSDLGLTEAAGRVSAWADQSGFGQDFLQANALNQPYLLGGTIDGMQLLSFGTAGAANKFMQTAANLKDRNGVDMDGAAARTVIVVMRPAFDAAYGVTGGKPWGVNNSWCAMFELRGDVVTDGAYAWEKTVDDFGQALQFTPITGGAAGPYDNVPTLGEWRSSGHPNFSFLVNNALVAVTPGSLFGTVGAGGLATLAFESIAFHGGICEVAVWDYDLSTNPTAHLAALTDFAARYPSLVLPISPPPVITPSRAIVIPGERLTFVASGGSGSGYSFGFGAGGNRSGGSIDTGTGEYEAGARGPGDDIIVLTDDAAGIAIAEVSVTGTLYRSYQSKTPAGRKGQILMEVERVFGSEKDVQFERARQAALAALPTVGPPDAVDYIGEDRGLPRSVAESPPDGAANDQAFAERLRTVWEAEDGWSFGGSHGGMLRALERAGFPSGDPTGAFLIQRTKLVSWLAAGVVTFMDHPGWTFDFRPPSTWHQFGLLFFGDFMPPIGSSLADGDPSAALLNALVRQWKPAKARFMGTWIIISGPTWGWPVTDVWGGGGLTWGGGSTRFVEPG